MKKLSITLISLTLGLFLGTYTQAQVGTHLAGRTLQGASVNPGAQHFTDTGKFLAFQFPAYGQLSYNMSFLGDAQKQLGFAIYGDGEIDFNPLREKNGRLNYFGQGFGYNLLGTRFKILPGKPEWNAEVSWNASFRFNHSFQISNALLSLAGGNAYYSGQTLVDPLTSKSLGEAYTQYTAAYRMNIPGIPELSAGIDLSLIDGHIRGDLNISESEIKYGTADENYPVDIMVKGQLRMSGVAPKSGDQYPEPEVKPGMLFENPGFAASLGGTYKINDQFQAGLALKDLGMISWRKNSRSYTLSNTIHFEGVDFSNEDSMDSLIDRYTEFISDSSFGRFTTSTPSRIFMHGTYQWHPRFSTTGLVSIGLTDPFKSLHIVQDIRAFGPVHFMLNGAVGNKKFTQAGITFLIRSRSIDYFFGSEQAFNMISGRMSPGVGFYGGLAFRIGHAGTRPAKEEKAPKEKKIKPEKEGEETETPDSQAPNNQQKQDKPAE